MAPTAEIVALCPLEEIPEGEARGFDPDGTGRETVLAVRRGDRVHGYRNLCPHYGRTPLGWRRGAYLNTARDRIVCFAHGAEFDIPTGACTIGPCKGQALQRLDLRVAEGMVLWHRARAE